MPEDNLLQCILRQNANNHPRQVRLIETIFQTNPYGIAVLWDTVQERARSIGESMAYLDNVDIVYSAQAHGIKMGTGQFLCSMLTHSQEFFAT
jgi:hypothetical protein